MLDKRATTNGRIYTDIKNLQVWDKNPRIVEKEKDMDRLKRQLAFLGQYKPLIVTEDGVVVGGNQRLKSMIFLNENVFAYEDKNGKHEIDLRGQFNEIWITELSFGKVDGSEPVTYKAIIDGKPQSREYPSIEQIMIEYAISDNDGVGQYDQKALYDLISSHQELIPMENYKLELSAPVSLKTFIAEFKRKDQEEGEEDDAPALAPEGEAASSSLGTVYQLGRHRLICGDATKPEAYEKLLGENKADMIFTDPPYNVSYEGKTKDALKIQGDTHTSSDFYTFLSSAFKNMFDKTKSGASIYVCHADTERVNFTKAFQDAGWKLAQIVIWAKTHFVMGRQDYQWMHEPILYGWKEGGAHYFNGGHSQTTIWHIDKPTKASEHPTMKPIQLIARALNNSSKGDDIVLDPFLGSGSTLIACEQLGRTCYGIELDPKYCDVIRKRYAKFVGQQNWEEATPAVSAPVEGVSEQTPPTGEVASDTDVTSKPEGGENVSTV